MTTPDKQPTEEIDPYLTTIELIQMHYAEYRSAPDGVERLEHMNEVDRLLDNLLALGFTAVKAAHGTTA